MLKFGQPRVNSRVWRVGKKSALIRQQICTGDTLSAATGSGMKVIVWILQAARGSGWGRWLLTNGRPVGVACEPGLGQVQLVMREPTLPNYPV